MKKNSFLLMLLFMTAHLFAGWSSESSKVTDFYYYQNKQFKLTVKPNKLFIKTKDVVSESDFRRITGQYILLAQNSKFDINVKEQFVDLNNMLDNASINELVSAVQRNPEVDLVSAVYAPNAESKVLQGVEDQCIAQFKSGVSQAQINNYLSVNGLTIVKQLEISGGTTLILKISKSLNQPTIDVSNSIYESGLVNFCDPDFYYAGLLTFIPNDTFFPLQWSVKNTGTNIPGTGTGTAGCDMRVDSAWNITLGVNKCVVGMVDSGIDTTHPDLAGNMMHGYNYDFINGHAGGIDDFNHGTCTGGIVAALGNNALGTSGIAPASKLIAVKIFNSAGSTTTTALTQGLTWSWNQGEWISSNSWGGGSPVAAADQTILDGVTLGRSGKGCVFTVAAGNGNGPVQWPSTNPNVICVGGNSPCNQRKSPTSCDNETFWGASFGTGMSIVAPCVKIYATDRQGGSGYSGTDYFDQFNGTSSATPNCAGVVALALARDSTQRWDTVRVRLCRTADKVGSYSYTSAGPYAVLGSTWNNEMGYGKINAFRFLSSLGPPPPPPAHDILAGPFLSLPSQFIINTPYNIRSLFTNGGANNETGIPCKFFVDGVLINTTNINLVVNAYDSVTNSWQTPAAGNHTLKYVAALGTDLNRNNDTVTVVINVLPSVPTINQGSFCRSGLTIPIPDLGTATDNLVISVPNSTTVTDVNVRIDTVFHTYDSDLQFTLTKGATNVNFIQNAGGSGDNFIRTVLNDSASTPIASAVAPCTGSFQPSSSLAAFNGATLNGTWTLAIVDQAGQDSGMLKAWCLVISYNALVGGIQTVEIPNYYSLNQNYPNPFNPTTQIKYSLPKNSNVTLKVYDLLGKEVAILVNENMQAGFHTVDFNASNLASGVYFYKIQAGDYSAIKKMVLVK